MSIHYCPWCNEACTCEVLGPCRHCPEGFNHDEPETFDDIDVDTCACGHPQDNCLMGISTDCPKTFT